MLYIKYISIKDNKKNPCSTLLTHLLCPLLQPFIWFITKYQRSILKHDLDKGDFLLKTTMPSLDYKTLQQLAVTSSLNLLHPFHSQLLSFPNKYDIGLFTFSEFQVLLCQACFLLLFMG